MLFESDDCFVLKNEPKAAARERLKEAGKIAGIVVTAGIRLGRNAWHLASSRSSERYEPRPAVPEGVRVYAIGDIHGRFDLLDNMLDRLDADLIKRRCRSPIVIFLGDYVDRGPDSASVIERLIEIRVTHKAICLKGNHDATFAQFLRTPATIETWGTLGGVPTLMSYGLNPPLQPRAADGKAVAETLALIMPTSHRAFLDSLLLNFTCGDYFFVHAGVRPKVPLDRQTEDDLLWIRDEFLFYDGPYDKTIVHAHTPVLEPDIRRNRINIDTGAFATGRLTCLVLEGRERRFL